MTARAQLPSALVTLAETALGVARRSPSARLTIARAGGILEPEAWPEPVREAVEREVRAAREAVCRPLAAGEVERVLKAAWGAPPAKVLDELDPEPLAVTPAAQIHRGQYDGVPIAVKVRRPGIERAVRNDLALLDVLAGPLRSAFPRLDAGAILRDAREQLLDELDFEHEASTQRRAARAVRDVAGVTVPRPQLDLCAADVLVADLAPGETLAGARPADPAAAARALVDALRGATLDAGLAPVDLRASHVVVGPRDELALLGMGTSRPVDRDRARRALTALRALAGDDAALFGERVEATGLLPAAEAAEAHGVVRAVTGALLDGPAVLDAAALRGVGERAWQAAPELARPAAAASPHPEDLALGRAFGQLVAVLARLRAREDWAALIV